MSFMICLISPSVRFLPLILGLPAPKVDVGLEEKAG